MKNQKLTPAALGGKQFRWAMQEPVWQERSVCFVSVLFFVAFYAVLSFFYSILITITTKTMEQSIFET